MKTLIIASFLTVPVLFGQSPLIQSVLNSASYETALAPGTWTAIFGSQLAESTTIASAIPFPTQLGGVSVTFAGKAAPLSFVSPGQVNALIPFDAATLLNGQTVQVPVAITTSGRVSTPFTVILRRNAPAIYTRDASGKGAALAFDANFNSVTTIDGRPIVLYATGLGMTTPDAVTNEVTSGLTLQKLQDAISVSIGGSPATVLFAGLAPGLHGIYQINVMPKGPFLGDGLSSSVGSYISSLLTLPVPQGLNVSNLSGSITGLYPATGERAATNGGKATTGDPSFSVLLTAATFTTAFDVIQKAEPFSVVAIAGNYRTTFSIDPANKTWTSTASVPTAAERAYDFSARLSSLVYDFLSGSPFPGNILPQSRLDPLAVRAASEIPLANSTDGAYHTAGTIPANGHLVLSGSFGGFTNYARTFSRQSVSVPFVLYVDSKPVASDVATVTFQ